MINNTFMNDMFSINAVVNCTVLFVLAIHQLSLTKSCRLIRSRQIYYKFF